MPYMYSKTLAEKAAWEYKDKIPGLVTVCPFLVLGPLVHRNALSTSNKRIIGYFKDAPPTAQMPRLAVVDVRDVAKAHVIAAEHPNAPHSRLLAASASLHVNEILAMLRKWADNKAPELQNKVAADVEDDPSLPVRMWHVDTAPLAGMGMGEWIDPQETLFDTASSLKESGFL